jgi:hypothetical protein
MTNENVSEPINILLSREELLLVLNLLEAESVPGLDADPLGELNVDGLALATIVAGRGLRARELARVGEDGELQVHSALLTAVGVCAYSSNTIFVYHWPGGEATPVRYFGHIRGDDIAAHTRPEDVLHQFTIMPSREHLIEQVLTVCEYAEAPQTSALELTVPEDDFVQIRELAGQGKVDEAVEYLGSKNINTEAGRAFVSTLAQSPRVSILQSLAQEDNEAVHKRDFTLVQNREHTWFIAPTTGEGESTPLLVKATNRDEVETLLAELL